MLYSDAEHQKVANILLEGISSEILEHRDTVCPEIRKWVSTNYPTFDHRDVEAVLEKVLAAIGW